MQSDIYIDIHLTDEPLDIEYLSDLSEVQCGAVVVFVGKTRPEQCDESGSLVSLQYSCYETLAKETIQSIADEAVEAFSVHAIRVAHHTDKVCVNHPSVVIAVGAMHRDEAFHACRFLIDTIKERVPIWKKEQWPNGSTWSKGVEIKLQ